MAIFIILGIIIIVGVVLVVVLRGEAVQRVIKTGVSKTISFSESVELVEKNVQDCLDKAVYTTYRKLSNADPEDYKEEFARNVKNEFSKCVSFGGLPVKVSQGEIKSVDVNYGADNTKVIVSLDYEVVVSRGDNVERLKDFYSEVSMFPTCCVPVEVDSDCKAKRATNVRSCGRLYSFSKNDKVENIKGDCIAC